MTRLGDILKALADKPVLGAADFVTERRIVNGWNCELYKSGFVRMTTVVNLVGNAKDQLGNSYKLPFSLDASRSPVLATAYQGADGWAARKAPFSYFDDDATRVYVYVYGLYDASYNFAVAIKAEGFRA